LWREVNGESDEKAYGCPETKEGTRKKEESTPHFLVTKESLELKRRLGVSGGGRP